MSFFSAIGDSLENWLQADWDLLNGRFSTAVKRIHPRDIGVAATVWTGAAGLESLAASAVSYGTPAIASAPGASSLISTPAAAPISGGPITSQELTTALLSDNPAAALSTLTAPTIPASVPVEAGVVPQFVSEGQTLAAVQTAGANETLMTPGATGGGFFSNLWDAGKSAFSTGASYVKAGAEVVTAGKVLLSPWQKAISGARELLGGGSSPSPSVNVSAPGASSKPDTLTAPKTSAAAKIPAVALAAGAGVLGVLIYLLWRMRK